jgi:hypothetical protein
MAGLGGAGSKDFGPQLLTPLRRFFGQSAFEQCQPASAGAVQPFVSFCSVRNGKPKAGMAGWMSHQPLRNGFQVVRMLSPSLNSGALQKLHKFLMV